MKILRLLGSIVGDKNAKVNRDVSLQNEYAENEERWIKKEDNHLTKNPTRFSLACPFPPGSAGGSEIPQSRGL